MFPLPGEDVSCRTPSQNFLYCIGSMKKLFFGEIFQIEEEGEDISTVIEVERPSLKGTEHILFQTRYFLSMRARHQHPTPCLLAPIICLQMVQSLPCVTANKQLLASQAGSSVHCALLFGAGKVGRLHQCASLIDSWLMDGR